MQCAVSGLCLCLFAPTSVRAAPELAPACVSAVSSSQSEGSSTCIAIATIAISLPAEELDELY